MKLAFCLFKYFPFGGLQRDFLRIAKECARRGHQVVVYTQAWEGERPPELVIHQLDCQGWQNYACNNNFVKQVQEQLQINHYDCVIGFNKMPGLDIYYAADVCFQARVSSLHGSCWYRWLARYRHMAAFEKAVFGLQAKTQILLIAKTQQAEFTRYYQTQPERFHLLPPGIAKDRVAPPDAAHIRTSVRSAYKIEDHEFLLLLVGSGFKTKGLDRCLLGLARVSENLKNRTKLCVIGKDNASVFQQQAEKLGIQRQVMFLGGRHDVDKFLLAADLLVHPAYHENTGTVLLEALASGLPVLTTDVCGYAEYVESAQAGKVLSSPFQQAQFNQMLETMLLSPERKQWQQNGLTFAKQVDIYSMPIQAVNIIESFKKC